MIDSGLWIVNDIGKTKQYGLFLSVLVIYVFLKREKLSPLDLCFRFFPMFDDQIKRKNQVRAQSHSLTFLKLGRYE